MRVGIYIRVSTREQSQEGYSIPAQTRLLELYCESQGWKQRKIYADPGLSAKDTNRPALQELKRDIAAGLIDVLLVYRLDRLTRSVQDLFNILNFLEENKCAFRSSTENYDTSTAMGRMFIGLVGLLAQWERENLGERVIMGMREKIINKNEASGVQPYGYMIDSKLRVINNVEEKNVLLMIDLYNRLGSIAAVAKELNKRNIPTRFNKGSWSHQTVRQVLRNPALCGTSVYDGEITEDAFTGIITKEHFKELSKSIESQNIIRLQSPTRGMFSGILECPQCEATLVKTETRYRCNTCYENDRGFIRVREQDLLKAFKEYAESNETEIIVDDEEEKNESERNFKEEIKRVEQRRLKFQKMYADDFMTYEELQKHMSESKKELEEIHNEQSKEPSKPISYNDIKKIKWMFTEHFEEMTETELVDFMMSFINRIKFERECIRWNKNDQPLEYKYTILNVSFKWLPLQ